MLTFGLVEAWLIERNKFITKLSVFSLSFFRNGQSVGSFFENVYVKPLNNLMHMSFSSFLQINFCNRIKPWNFCSNTAVFSWNAYVEFVQLLLRYGEEIKIKTLLLLYSHFLHSYWWPRGLRHRSAAARPLGLWIRIPPATCVCLSVVIVVCCQVEVSATSWSLVQRSPTDCVSSLCVMQKPLERGGPGRLGAAAPKSNKHSLCDARKNFIKRQL